MKDHYSPNAKTCNNGRLTMEEPYNYRDPVKTTDEHFAGLRAKGDDFTTGIAPGFYLPELVRKVSVSDLKSEKVPDVIAEKPTTPKMRLVFLESPIKMCGVEETTEASVDGFTYDEWEAMAELVD